jgi:hypothetical protein
METKVGKIIRKAAQLAHDKGLLNKAQYERFFVSGTKL